MCEISESPEIEFQEKGRVIQDQLHKGQRDWGHMVLAMVKVIIRLLKHKKTAHK